MADLVTVRIKLKEYTIDNYAEFAGRRIAMRQERDKSVWFGRGVVLMSGDLPISGGSVKNPRIEASPDVVAEIRDIPRASLRVVHGSYEIVSDTAPDVNALLAERNRLLARVAEIDALLPDGTI